MSNSSVHVGWTLESPGWGTLSLITTCMITTAICTWVVIHPRINKCKQLRLPHKLALWSKTLLAPELIAVEAAQEWMQAHRLVQQCSKTLDGELGIEQAFYIGMFGFFYRTKAGSKIIWPNQFHWLLERGLLNWNDHKQYGLDVDSIRDKSNADSFAKLFALVQVAGFVVQSILRAVHDLPLAPLESMTLGYIPLFAITYFYWWRKPKDIDTPSTIDLPEMAMAQREEFENLSIDDAFDDEGTCQQTSLWSIWALTPRVFEKEFADQEFERAEEEYAIQKAKYKEHSAMHSRTDGYKRLPPTPPRRRKDIVLGHWDPALYHSKLWPFACLIGVSFPALHLISWNAEFPTTVELWLWRASAITSICSMLLFMQFERVVIRWQDPLMVIKILSPVLYLLTRLIMLVLAMTAFIVSAPGIHETYVSSSYVIGLF